MHRTGSSARRQPPSHPAHLAQLAGGDVEQGGALDIQGFLEMEVPQLHQQVLVEVRQRQPGRAAGGETERAARGEGGCCRRKLT